MNDKKVTFELSVVEMCDIASQSSIFVHLMATKLANPPLLVCGDPNDGLHTYMYKSTPTTTTIYPNKHINELYDYVAENFDKNFGKIAAIKYVRNWVQGHSGLFLKAEIAELTSLIGAKRFVEGALGLHKIDLTNTKNAVY
jgi:hypothetical protein